MRNPVAAYADLIDDLRRYARGQLTWLDVRRILSEADQQLHQYLACEDDLDSDCADRLRALAMRPQYAAIAGELLHAAAELDGRHQHLVLLIGQGIAK